MALALRAGRPVVLLDWDVGPPPVGLDQERADALVEEAHKELSSRVRDLMVQLRGEGAD